MQLVDLVWILTEASQLQRDIVGAIGENLNTDWVLDVIKELVFIIFSFLIFRVSVHFNNRCNNGLIGIRKSILIFKY